MMLNLLGFIQSDDSRCGVASIKSILYYYGIDQNEDTIAIACQHSYELGCTNENMVRALQSFGLGAILKEKGTIEDLAYWNRHHIPVIVDFFTPGTDTQPGDMPNGHSGIIVNVDKSSVYLLDPENGKIRQIYHEDFRRVWVDWDIAPYIKPNIKLNIGVMIIPFAKRLLL